MNLQSFKQNFGFLVGVMILSLLVSSSVVAQQGATISGRVVDELGNPVVGASVALHRYKAIEDDERPVRFVPFWQKPVDLDGSFSFVNIAPTESVSFIVEDERTKGKILSIQMGELTLYPGDHPHFGKVRFALEAGMDIEDVVITVNTNIPPQVRARVVSADGTPLVNTTIYVAVQRKSLDGTGGGGSGGTRQTDAEGYFVEDLRVDDNPRFYVLGVKYHGLFAKAPPFILHEGQPQVHLLLTLNGNLDPLARPPGDPLGGPPPSAALTAFLDPPTVWIVNPANGHAYKKIHCDGVVDATTQAAAENAYLVAINDEAENEWLTGIFERERFWIGLNDVAEEGQLVWDSGEPVTYTNWGEHERVGNNTEVNDYVISGHGRWEMVAPGSGHAHFVKTAILERTDVPGETPSEDN
ncbi:MAG: lectin-like protein [Candidatus Poribacteria bacterium]|nr:lectin-like protein [Candidatus Poribacteria bacterium]